MTTCGWRPAGATAVTRYLGVRAPWSPAATGQSGPRLHRRNGVLVGVGGVHAPPEIVPVGHRKKRRLGPPTPAPEGPQRLQQVEAQAWIEQPAPQQAKGQHAPGGRHGRSITPGQHRETAVYSRVYDRRSGLRAAAGLPGGVPDFPPRRLPQQLLAGRLVNALPGAGGPMPRSLGDARRRIVVRRVVGCAGRAALALRPRDRRGRRDDRAASQHLRPRSPRLRSRWTTGAAPAWW